MPNIDYRIHQISKLTDFINSNDTFPNRKDIRRITLHTLALTSQNFMFSLILSKELMNLNYCKNKISPSIELEDLETMHYNFDGYVKNAFFINSFVCIENHLRQIASYYERKPNDINVTSITQTFKNLIDKRKTILFQNFTNTDIELFEFYCFLRNTMHNVGFQTQNNKDIVIKDRDSVLNVDEIRIVLLKNSPNRITFDLQMLLHEQIIKLILKINSSLTSADFIEHRFTETGFLK